MGHFMMLNIHNDNAGRELDLNGSDLARKVFYSFTLCETDISLISGNPLGDFVYSSAFGTDIQNQVFHSTVSNG